MMQAETLARYASPFDAIAEQYDETFSSSIIGQLQRGAVWKELGKCFRPGDRVLDLGCGTGVDACFLAERGVDVVGCDKSLQMLRVAERRIASLSPTASSVRLRHVPAEEISSLSRDGLFDGALSNFGAVNCIDDVAKLAEDMGSILKPGATLLLCLMGPVCVWETVWYLLHGKPGKAFRRFRRRSVPATLSGGGALDVYYRSVPYMRSKFAPEFRVKSIRGIGVAVPPSYVEVWARRFPGLVRFGANADRYLGSCPGIRGFADHLLLRFERTAKG